jgi:hypothetical protein
MRSSKKNSPLREIQHLQDPLVRWFRRTYPESQAIILKNTIQGRRGWPDLTVFVQESDNFLKYSRGVLFIELKVPGQKLTKLQKRTHRQLTALGFDVDVHTNLDVAKEAIKQYVEWPGK